MKLFFYDLETTGVKYWKNGIHQFSGSIVIGGEVMERFNYKVKPYKDAIIEAEALAVAGVTAEQIQEYTPMDEVYKQLIALLSKYVDKFNKTDKFFTVGYNSASFDDAFLRAWFVQNGDNYFGSWFAFPNIDVAILAAHKLGSDRLSMQDFKLKTVAAKFGVEVDESKLHDAMYDIYLTREIYNKVK